MLRRLPILLLAVCALLSPRQSQAAFHISVIDEVMTSYGGDPTAQFVEIRMLAAGQNFVNGSTLGVFDASGNFLGEALTTGSDVSNGVMDGRWLMATATLATAAGITPDFVIPGPLLLPNGSGMVCWGIPINHADPSQYVDCVAYGAYTGPSNAHIGTPTAVDGEGHSLQRVTNTNNNAQDFICGDPSTPTNNAPMSGSLPATSACPPTPTPTVTPTATPTQTPTSATNDAVVLPPKPISVKIPVGAPSVVKNVKVKVRNGNVAGPPTVPIKLIATGCPGVVAGAPDFDSKMPGPQDTVMLAPGKTAKAIVPVTISSMLLTSFNEKAPVRCQLSFTATVQVPGNVDPTLTNNTAAAELSVLDLNDPDQVATPNHESTTTSLKPLSIKIAAGTTTVVKTVKLKVGNADLGEVAGHAITVTLGGGVCTAVGLPDFDPDTMGVQNTVTVAGGKTKTGVVTLTINSGSFTTANAKSPARCVKQLCAAGPMGNVEPETSNDCTALTIDVIDQNDF